jgi:hypothetical protein
LRPLGLPSGFGGIGGVRESGAQSIDGMRD